jgi:hypothetical protein
MSKSSNSRKNARGEHNGATKNRSGQSSSPVMSQFANALTPVYLSSVNRAAEFHKNAVNLAAEQTGEWIGACKDALSHLPMTPAGMFFDMAAQALQVSVESQKGTVDLVAEQTESMAQIAKDRAETYSKLAESAASAFQTTMMRSLETQKRVLESASEEYKANFAATRRKIGEGPASALVDSFERGADTVVRTQKSILEATAQPFVVAKA